VQGNRYPSLATKSQPFVTKVTSTLVWFLVWVIAATSQAAAQSTDSGIGPNGTDSDWYFRYELFEMLLEKRGLAIMPRVMDAAGKPSESVIVLLGDLQTVTPETWSVLRRFISRGGNLLLATDRTTQISGFGLLDIGTVNVGPVESADPDWQYERYSDCIRIRDFGVDHPLTEGVSELVTNRSGWLTRPSSLPRSSAAWQVLAKFPDNVIPKASRTQGFISLYQDEGQSAGSAICVADASLFSNSMLWHSDNGLFAIRVADWLCTQKRSKLAYLVDGVPLASFLKSRPAPPVRMPEPSPKSAPQPVEVKLNPDSFLKFANLAIKKVADSNIVNETLRNQPRNLAPRAYFQGVWGFVALAILACLVWFMMRRMILLTPYLNPRNMKSWYEIRSAVHHPLDHNGSAAESLARDFCRKWTGRELVADWALFLEDLDLQPTMIGLESQERKIIRSLFEMAVFGKKSLVSDEQLLSLGSSIRYLLASRK
jgi:hypothetical protein